MKTQNLPEDYLQEIGHRVRVIRTFLRLDQRQMAKLLKTTQSQLSKVESGKQGPSLYQLIRMKKLAEEDDYLREKLSWEWIMEGKGKGIIG